MTRILYLLNEASVYVLLSVPFNEKPGAAAPMANVVCSSLVFWKQKPVCQNTVRNNKEIKILFLIQVLL